MDTRLALMTGADIPVPECQLTIHQPRLKEIAMIGEDDFFMGAQVLTINKSIISQGETILSDINNFQIFMTIMTEREASDKKRAVLQLLEILFPLYKINLLPRSIMFSSEGNNIIIDEGNFDYLQDALKPIFCFSSKMNDSSFNPADAAAQAIADKLMRARQRVAAQSGEQGSSTLSQYISILVIGLNSMSLNECIDLTLFQLFDLMERYSLYMNWDIDIRSRLAGAHSESSLENWMKNIH